MTAAKWITYPSFYAHLGLELEALGEGKSRIRLPYRSEFGNSRGEVHGGIMASIMDIAMSQAIRSTLDAMASIATMSLTLNYIGPGQGELIAQGELVRRGRSTAFAEDKVFDARGELVCTAVGTFKARAGKE